MIIFLEWGSWKFKTLTNYVKILSAKFDFEKVKQNKVREVLVQSQNGHFGFEFSHVTTHIFNFYVWL